MLKDAPVLILDETTSAVDTGTEARVQAALDRLTERRTTFVIAHRLSTMRRADEIALLQAGRIVERGSRATAMRGAAPMRGWCAGMVRAPRRRSQRLTGSLFRSTE